MKNYYSQHGEDRLVAQYIQDREVPWLAVELGALDGVRNSNIRHFLEMGWKGIWVEPSRENFELLSLNARGLDVELHNVAIADKPGEAEFYYYAQHPGGSSLVHHSSRLFPQHNRAIYNNNITYKVKCQRAIDIIGTRDVGLLSIDCEDMDTIILADVIKSKIRPCVFVVEGRSSDEKRMQLEIAITAGYQRIAEMASNQIFSRI